MKKSKKIVENTVSLADMTTWQSGIIQSAASRSVKKLTDDYLAPHNLSTMHWFIVGAVYDAGDQGIRITDLSKKLGTTMGYLTTAINQLELKGMIQRTDSGLDSRTKLLTIPFDYLDQCQDIEDGLRDLFRKKLYSSMTRDELQIYITVLQKLAAL